MAEKRKKSNGDGYKTINKYIENEKDLRRLILLATVAGNSPRRMNKSEKIFFILFIISPIIIFIIFPNLFTFQTSFSNNPLYIMSGIYVMYAIIVYLIIDTLQKKAVKKVRIVIKFEKDTKKKIIPDDLRDYLPKELLK
jgi:hypothetical protein